MRRLASALVLLLAAGCAPPPHIPVPIPPTAPVRHVQVTIRNAPTPSATLLTDDGLRVECPLTILADGVPRAVCALNPNTPSGWGAHLTASAPDYIAQTVDFALSQFDTSTEQGLPDILLSISFTALPRWVRAGQFFRLSTGDAFTVVETSDFNLYARFLAGEDIEPILHQRATLGFNTLRVFTAYNVALVGRLSPREHADYYVRLPAFLQACARHGLYVELVGFTGPYGSFFDNPDQMVAHWDALMAAVKDSTNAELELINEWQNPPNAGVPLERMQRPPPPTLASHGSGAGDSAPLEPFWDYVTYHASEPRKVVHNGMSDYADPFDIPVVVNETVRVPDNNASLANAEDTANGCALLQAGCAFHSVHGKDSTLFTGRELELATAWATKARAVPLEYQQGFYVHLDTLEPGPAPCPCERVYARRLLDGRQWLAFIRP